MIPLAISSIYKTSKNKTSNLKPKKNLHAENYTEDTKLLIATQCPIDCPENETTDVTSILSTPILNKQSHSETDESLAETYDQEKETDKTNTAQRDSSDYRTDVSITLNSSHNETMSKPFEEEPINKNLHFHFQLTTEPNRPTEETNSNGDAIAEEPFNHPEIQNADQRRQANLQKTFLLDKKEFELNFVVDSPNILRRNKIFINLSGGFAL